MKHHIVIGKDHTEASRYAAGLIAEAFLEKPELTVTFAAGDTPFACYHELIKRRDRGELTLDQAFYIGLDEWAGLGPETEGSCIASMNCGYYGPAGIPSQQTLIFNGLAADLEKEAKRMNDAMAEHPLDLVVLGVGVNGHVGFNEPGATATGDFSLVALSETTQTVGKKYFSGNQTPTLGATITLQALARAKKIILLATGPNKREAVRAVLDKRADLPVCAFLEHPGAHYVFDEEAAGEKANKTL